jgi:hypothetical protein
MNTDRLMTIVVALTDGETASLTSWRPWTIHGWRPFSVSIQPAVFMRSGSTTAQTASRGNHLAVASFLRHSSQAAHATPQQPPRKPHLGPQPLRVLPAA